MPDYRLAVHGQLNRQVVRRESPSSVRRVSEHERACIDFKRMTVVGNGAGKLRHRQPPIEKNKRGVIFKVPVCGPFHADHLRREHGESRIAQCESGRGIGYRVGDFRGWIRRLAWLAIQGSVQLSRC